MSDNEGKLLDHEYDGIRELDNNLPLWWLWTFFGTIIFSFIYWLHYSYSGDGPTLDQELAVKMAAIQEQRQTAERLDADGGTENLESLIADGKNIFKNYCASCHLESGGGSVGPNLTDDYWIHDKGETETVARVVKEGVLDKGMPSWQGILKPRDIRAVVGYIETLKGTNVAGGKAPEGTRASQ